MVKDNIFPLRLAKRQGYLSALTIPIQYHTGGHSWCNKARKSKKRHTDWKGRNQTVSLQRT